MIDIDDLRKFVALGILLNLTPGSDVLFVVSLGLELDFTEATRN
jgi:threonine/homoserine/homoserine lactone efflux protein